MGNLTDRERAGLQRVLSEALGKLGDDPVFPDPSGDQSSIEVERDVWRTRAEIAEDMISEVREVLQGTGHPSEGESVYLLVDAAIDTERCRREQEIAKLTRTFSHSIQREQRAAAMSDHRANDAEERLRLQEEINKAQRATMAEMEKAATSDDKRLQSALDLADVRLTRIAYLENALQRIQVTVDREFKDAEIIPF